MKSAREFSFSREFALETAKLKSQFEILLAVVKWRKNFTQQIALQCKKKVRIAIIEIYYMRLRLSIINILFLRVSR